MWQIAYEDELYHHGIKGQKWGIRRYQNEDGTLTPEGRRRYGVGMERIRSIDDIPTERGKARYLKDMAKINKKDTSNTEKQGLTDKQKKAIVIGAVAAIGTLAVAGTTIYLVKSGKGAELINSGKNAFNSIKDKLTRVPLDATNLTTADTTPGILKKPMDISKPHRNLINPYHLLTTDENDGFKNNCLNCSVAADMRSKGYDVCARMNSMMWPTNPDNAMIDIYGKPFTRFTPPDFKDEPLGSMERSARARLFFEDSIKTLTGKEDGHGILLMVMEHKSSWNKEHSIYNGHAINWCKKGNNIIFIDNQSKSNINADFFSHITSESSILNSELDIRPKFIRTDNANIDMTKAGAFAIDRKTALLNSIVKGIDVTESFKGSNKPPNSFKAIFDSDKHITASHQGHIKEQDIDKIKSFVKQGMSIKEIADNFDVTPGAIYDILKR